MTTLALLLRSLRYHRREHLAVLAGTACATAVIVGALGVGDSVRAGLRGAAAARLGSVDLALEAPDRFFRAALAERMEATLPAPVAPVLRLAGVCSRPDGTARASGVQVCGVDAGFGRLAPVVGAFPGMAAGEAALGRRLAARLGVAAGDEVVLRVERPALLPRDAPMAPEEGAVIALPVRVAAVLGREEFGEFGLRAEPIPPLDAFVDRAWLAERVGLPGRANLLLVGVRGGTAEAKLGSGPVAGGTVEDQPGPNPVAGGTAEARRDAGQGGDGTAADDGSRVSAADAALRRAWTLADAELELRRLDGAAAPGALELRSGRVFLDPPVARAALEADPEAAGVLAYLVNELRAGERAAPYSVVAAYAAAFASAAPAPGDGRDIAINEWLAEDLEARVGAELRLTWYTLGPRRRLLERTGTFRVSGVVPLQGFAADRELMPTFPGIAGTGNCRDWAPGFAIDLARVRDRDEEYWDRWGGTPKAFVRLDTGRALWGNRFGDLTAVRYPAGRDANALAGAILARLDPRSLGLAFVPARSRAEAAATQGMDFGALFAGFSVFLLAAAIALVALIYGLAIDRRGGEVGTLLALGFTPARVRRLLLGEAAVPAVAGALLGAPAGALYTEAVLHALATAWRAVLGEAVVSAHVDAGSWAVGLGAGVVSALGAAAWMLRRRVRRPARELLALAAEAAPGEERGARRCVGHWAALAFLAVAAGLTATAGTGRDRAAAGAFFGAGAALLCAGLSLAWFALGRLVPIAPEPALTLGGLAVRNCGRRRGRSLAVVGILAAGVFLVTAVEAFRRDPADPAGERTSGTGGFALCGESALPIVQDLDSPGGRAAFALAPEDLAEVHVVPLRLREGDDASCRSLNRAQRPPLLGVDPAALAGRFTFVRALAGMPAGWATLAGDAGGDVPGVIDEATHWALGASVGDVLTFEAERGDALRVRIAAITDNSVLHGGVTIAEDRFLRAFPSAAGYRRFLVDAPPARAEAVARALTRALADSGLELVRASTRLDELNAVENAYLSIFQALGGLGLLLGSAGLAAVVFRNVLERRGELALLQAVGFGRRRLVGMVLGEHAALVLGGIAIGLVASGLAVLPAFRAPAARLPVGSLAATVAVLAALGLGWAALASALALRGRVPAELRRE